MSAASGAVLVATFAAVVWPAAAEAQIRIAQRRTTLPPPEEEEEEAPPPPRAKKKRPPPPDEEASEDAPRPRRRTVPPPPAEDEEAEAPRPRRLAPAAEPEPRPPPPRRRSRSAEEEDDPTGGFRDDDDNPRRQQLHSAQPYTAEEDLDAEYRATDAIKGFAGEFSVGWMFVDGTRGGGSDGRFAVSVKAAVWEFGRRFTRNEEDWARHGLAAELTWTYSSVTGIGTQQVSVDTYHHYLALGWLVGWPLGAVLLYGEVGPVLNFQPVSYLVKNTPDDPGERKDFTAVRFHLFGGGGARTRIEFHDGRLVLVWRLEVLRYPRATFAGLGIGLGF